MTSYVSQRKNCVLLDQVTKQIFHLSSNSGIGELEETLITVPKVRRGSAELSERAFFRLTKLLPADQIFEIGGNDALHTRRFLAGTSARIHTFEPNIHCFQHYSDIIGDPRLCFNAFGLSASTGVRSFNILEELNGNNLPPVNGCSSFARAAEGTNARYKKSVALTTTASDYIRQTGESFKDFAIWLDAEGSTLDVLKGFDEFIVQGAFCLCEVEFTDMLTTGANADDVIKFLNNSGYEIMFRDFQNFGQCNILAVNRRFIATVAKPLNSIFSGFITSVQNSV